MFFGEKARGADVDFEIIEERDVASSYSIASTENSSCLLLMNEICPCPSQPQRQKSEKSTNEISPFRVLLFSARQRSSAAWP